MKSIALIGLPGAGKTLVGRQLAQRLQCDFVDSDHVIEARLGCSIREYFEREGEAAFRSIETQILDELSLQGANVLSTGGGACLSSTNRAFLHERCRVVYLFARPDALAQRLRHDRNRPLLQGTDLLTRLTELYTQRDALYRETAHHVVTVGKPSVYSLVREVLAQLGLPE